MATEKLGRAIDELVEELSAPAVPAQPQIGTTYSGIEVSDTHQTHVGRWLTRMAIIAVLGFGACSGYNHFFTTNSSSGQAAVAAPAITATAVPIATPKPAPTATPKPAPTAAPSPTPAPKAQTVEPGQYIVNKSVWNESRNKALTVESIDVLNNGTMRLNYYGGATGPRWDFFNLFAGSASIEDNLGKKYDLLNGEGGGGSGWMLFSVLQPGATSFYLSYPYYSRLNVGEMISQERYKIAIGNYKVNQTASYSGRDGSGIMTLESVDALEKGKMALNVFFTNTSQSAYHTPKQHGTFLIDGTGRRYEVIYGQGSEFEKNDTLFYLGPKQVIRSRLFFPALIDGQTEATLHFPNLAPIRFKLGG